MVCQLYLNKPITKKIFKEGWLGKYCKRPILFAPTFFGYPLKKSPISKEMPDLPPRHL